MRRGFWPTTRKTVTCPNGRVTFVSSAGQVLLCAGFLLSLTSLPTTAQDIRLISPIDCDLTGPCHIQQYVDRDPTDAARDFSCGTLSYDGHKGTDFALPTRAMIADGIVVRASAAGTVAGKRDGMDDTGFSAKTADQIANRECGNGVLLIHPGGWETQYCHLRKGSVSVSAGQEVEVGQALGEVGMSGRAQFPHVHISVRRDGKVIDPFDPAGATACGAPPAYSLWATPLAVRPGGIIQVGTSESIPDFTAIKAGEVPSATADGEAIVFWSYLFGTRADDVLRLSLTGPEGFEVRRDFTFERAQAQSFRAIGRKSSSSVWPSGTYAGSADLLRNGALIERKEITLELR